MRLESGARMKRRARMSSTRYGALDSGAPSAPPTRCAGAVQENSTRATFDFHLTNQQGNGVRLSQWRGQVILFVFGFTHCPSVCPTTLTNLATIYQALSPADRERVRIAFISVDTHRDTPMVLQSYLSYFGPTFVGLTGSKEDIDRVTGAYGASRKLQRHALVQPLSGKYRRTIGAHL
jgi:cytochrome oxidase Cu insertion factor (SCO1/SenC/PrrC family)